MGIATTLKKATREVEKAITGKEPQMDILDTLAEEHEVVAALLQKLVDGKSSAERTSLLKKVKQNLVPHARAEEAVLYNAVMKAGNKAQQTDGEEGFIEHNLVDVTIKKLGTIKDKMSPEFGAAAKVLKELIAHHVKEEESNVWSDVKAHFSAEARQKMNVVYLQKKKAVRIPA